MAIGPTTMFATICAINAELGDQHHESQIRKGIPLTIVLVVQVLVALPLLSKTYAGTSSSPSGSSALLSGLRLASAVGSGGTGGGSLGDVKYSPESTVVQSRAVRGCAFAASESFASALRPLTFFARKRLVDALLALRKGGSRVCMRGCC